MNCELCGCGMVRSADGEGWVCPECHHHQDAE